MSVPVPQGLDSGLTDYLAAIPAVEIKVIDQYDSANLPLVVLTDVERPEAVTCVQALNADDGTPQATLVAWKRSEDPDEPGVQLTATAGLTSGTTYSIVLRIEGSRRRAAVVDTDRSRLGVE